MSCKLQDCERSNETVVDQVIGMKTIGVNIIINLYI